VSGLFGRLADNIRKLPGKVKRDFEQIVRPSETRKGGSYGRGFKAFDEGFKAFGFQVEAGF
jgi:hypothetical protein